MIYSRGQNFSEKVTSEENKEIHFSINENSNPFTINHSANAMLKNIATGQLVERYYIEHILCAKSIGQAVVEEFIEVKLNEISFPFGIN